jgi:hypothetical protein
MKTAVYSWRVSSETKAALEDEARQRDESVAELLDRIAREWLELQRGTDGGDRQREERIRARALSCCGTIAGGDPDRASRVREDVRERLRSRRAGHH